MKILNELIERINDYRMDRRISRKLRNSGGGGVVKFSQDEGVLGEMVLLPNGTYSEGASGQPRGNRGKLLPIVLAGILGAGCGVNSTFELVRKGYNPNVSPIAECASDITRTVEGNNEQLNCKDRYGRNMVYNKVEGGDWSRFLPSNRITFQLQTPKADDVAFKGARGIAQRTLEYLTGQRGR